ncbi:MAG: alkaline phosphatase family protein [Planctomycetes bacterium]|nr:alkaline phosphatase family protein [Planctomycetota bacterium]
MLRPSRIDALILFVVITTLTCPVGAGETPAKRRTENVIVVTLDGFRFQEFFGGADETLLNKQFGGIKDLAGTKKNYWREKPTERREVLLPFFWRTIARSGQIFGDRSRKAHTRLTNGLKFSYPGYSEIFCGFADPGINSNAKKVNPNLSVLEFLHQRPGYQKRVAAFCTWDVFPYILRAERSGIKVHEAWKPIQDAPLTPRQSAMNGILPTLPRYWPDNCFDAVTMEYAREHLLRHKPRVFFIGLGETDEWGHGRRYDLYLDAAHKADRFLAELWQTLQKMPAYKDKTSLVITTDHGRGDTRVNWTDHGKKVPLAELIWIAVLGPDTPALGVRENVETTQSQVAATIAHLLGENFATASPRAAPPLPGVTRR